MAYAPHARVSFGGSLNDPSVGSEIWNCNVNVLGPAGGNVVTYMNAIAAPLATWFAAPANRLSNQATLDYVKVNHIDPDGTYSDKANTNQHDYSPGVAGGTNRTQPEILSTVTTWRTSKARGPGSHGRIYLPNCTSPAYDSIILPDAYVLAVANAGRALINLLEVGFGGAATAVAVVASNVDGSANPITAVSVGNVIDVQRRRKSAVRETYTTVAV